MSTQPAGRRERKKAALRQTIAEVAVRLFLERGFDEVTISEIAEAADVARTTLFSYFPTKEALVFAQDQDWEQRLVNAVRDRPANLSLPQALRQVFHAIRADAHAMPDRRAHRDLIENTPALQEYSAGMWMRHADALAQAISADLGEGEEPSPLARVMARFVLDTYPLSRQGDSRTMIDQTFELIENGWTVTSAHARTQ